MNHEQFESLKPEEQEKVFHQSSFKDKGDLILHAHYPERLAQSLSQEELYLVTREMDLGERSEIIRYANLPQLFFISDIDCWKKDRISPKGFIQWLETLKEADENRLLAWLLQMDYETVVSGFKSVIEVLKPDWEYASDELLGDRPYFTLDDRYFICVQEENHETVKRAFEILFENRRGSYTAILEGILSEVSDVLEEEAYRKREMRFADRGFPDPDTAHKIYRPITQQEWDASPPKHFLKQKTENSSSTAKVPHYPVLWSSEQLFLDQVLLLLKQEGHEIAEGIEEELAWLSNKVIACQGIDFSSENHVRQGAERVRRFLNIGLEILSGRDLARASKIMKEKWLEMIFRWASAKLLETRDRASEVLHSKWGGTKESFLEFLNAPYDFIFRGLLQPEPQYYDSTVQDHTYFLRDFKNEDEIQKGDLAVRQIDALLAWLMKQSSEDLPECSLFTWLGTGFAAFVLRGKISFAPLNQKEIQGFGQKGFEKKGDHLFLKSSFKEEFSVRFFREEEKNLLRPLWALVFQEIEEELGGLNFSKPIDARYISTLRFQEGEILSPKKKRVRKKRP